MSDTLLVSEVFGPTFQGEGPSTGRRCGFVRLALCNLDCSWCDAAYTWDWKRFDRNAEVVHSTAAEVVAQVDAMDVRMVVITGGEPLVQPGHLLDLVRMFDQRDYRIEVETNGTRSPGAALVARVDQWNVSPKLAHSGVDPMKAMRPAALIDLVGYGAVFKFVVTNADEDLDEVADLVDGCGIPATSVWIMPEGTDINVIQDRAVLLADAVLERGWNMSGRLHIDLWGNQRAR